MPPPAGVLPLSLSIQKVNVANIISYRDTSGKLQFAVAVEQEVTEIEATPSMLRLRRKVDRSVAFVLLRRHQSYQLKPFVGVQRSYSTSNPSEEPSVTETPPTNAESSQGDAKSHTRYSKLNSNRARRREQLLLKGEQRASLLRRKATLTKEEPEKQGHFSENREKSTDADENVYKDLDAAGTPEIIKRHPKRSGERFQQRQRQKSLLASRTIKEDKDQAQSEDSKLDRSIVEEQSQDAGGIRLQTTRGMSGLTGMFTSLRDRLQSMARSPPTSEDGETPLFAGSSHLGENATSYRETAPSVNIKDLLDAREATGRKKPTKRENSKGKAGKTKKSSDQEDDESSSPTTAKSKRLAKRFDPALVHTIRPGKLRLCPVENDEAPDVPRLAHKLDRVLFNSGVYDLQDKRSRVYNFDPYLSTIMPVEEFDFNALKDYITSSKDSKLRSLSAKHGMKYCGSTSSMTAMLSQFHFLLSAWRSPEYEHLSRSFHPEFKTFTMITRAPAAAFARLQDGVYAIDADKEFDTANILSMLGKSMEKLLTLPKEDFEKYRREHSHQLTEEEKNADEAFHYTTFGDFMLRSQLDAHDPRLPGTGMFDLKTRAVVTIRMDVQDYEKGVGYEISRRFGQWESYEREYYDMIRSAFLKYSLQVRMGRMDGIFVAFHNTQRIFGFQYISLQEMDEALHGTSNLRVGDEEFRVSLSLLNDLLNRASERFPGRSLRLHVETRPTNPPLTYFFAEPVTDEEMNRTQATGAASVKKFETEVLGLNRKKLAAEAAPITEEVDHNEQELAETMEDQDAQASTPWDELMARVDETVENDSSGIDAVRDAIEQALEQTGLLKGKSAEEVESYLNLLVEALSSELSEGKQQTSTHEMAAEEEVLEEEEEEEEDPLAESLEEVSLREKTLREEHVEEENAVPETAQNSSQDETTLAEPSAGETSTEDPAGAQSRDSVETNTEDVAKTQSASEDDVRSNKSHEGSAMSENRPQEVELENNADADESKIVKENDFAEENNAVEEDISNDEGSKATGQDLSLKDLILKVAEGVDTKTGSLGAFEGMLSKLAEQSKQSTPPKHSKASKDEPEAQKKGLEDSSSEESIPAQERELLGMYVTVRNKVNNQVVERVNHQDHPIGYRWAVEYTVTELPKERAQNILRQLKNRRRKIFFGNSEDRNKLWYKLWKGNLAKRTEKSMKIRERLNKSGEGAPKYGAWDDQPISPADLDRILKSTDKGTKDD